MPELHRLVQETKSPDMIFLQEVRLKAAGKDHQRGKPLDSEYEGSVENAMQTVFAEYYPFWSLADTKYSGTLTLIHRRCIHDSKMEISSHEKTNVCAFTHRSAIELMLKRLGTNRRDCGLTDNATATSTYRTTSVASPNKTKRQTSMTSFFAPKSSPQTNGMVLRPGSHHHPQGRFQFFFFPDMDILQTYVPNNGTKDESFAKRQQWDKDMLQFFKDRRQILQTRGKTDRKLLWCGDLNVARDYRDGSHWKRKDDGEIYEYWTDESRCFVQSDTTKKQRANKGPENVGIPSFTPAERERFEEILQIGDFCDVWRELHPQGVTNQEDKNENPWDLPNYTWRGHLAKNVGSYAKYQGKAQRLDYFLLSPSSTAANAVQSCDILGYGERKEGLFCGSDHCAVRLELCTSSKT
jgi:exonuclease III